MSQQPRCSPESAWTGIWLGDCAQHLVRADSPYVYSGIILYQGAKYLSPPTVIFTGGGPYAEGAVAVPVMSDGTSGFVTRIRIIQGGWHYITHPSFICSGNFLHDAEHSHCSETAEWNDKLCACSGYALITGGRPFYQNVTLVRSNQRASDCTSARYPYIRRNTQRCHDDTPDCGDTNCEQCGTWGPHDVISCRRLPNLITIPNKIVWNCYLPTTGVVDYGVCRKIGWKAVQARKTFHGTIGFGLAGDDGCGGAILSSPLTTKYLTKTVSITYNLSQDWETHYSDTDSSQNHAGTNIAQLGFSYDVTVNKDNGVYTYGSCSQTSHLSPASVADWPIQRLTPPLVGVISLLAGMGTDCGYVQVPEGFKFFYNAPSGSLTPAAFATYLETNGTVVDPNNNQKNYSSTVTTANCSASRTHFHLDMHIADNWLTTDDAGLFAKSDSTLDLVVNITYSNPYTAADCVADLYDLLDQIPLNDDVLYPWRHDGYMSVAPLVTRNEVVQPTSPPYNNSCPPYGDVNEEYADGSVVGTMLPGGYDTFFDFDHVWNYFNSDSPSQTCVYGFGAWAGPEPGVGMNAIDPTDSAMPPNATQWTNQVDANDYEPGAWVRYNPSSKVFTAQKWAECLVYRPSYNFARPCGADRYTVNEDTWACLESYDEGAKTVKLNVIAGGGTDLPPAQTINTANPVRICGTDTSLDGVWNCTTSDNINYSLTTLICPGEQITGVFEYTFCGGGRIGEIRWPSAPAVCSTNNITGVHSGSSHTYAQLQTPSFLHSGDVVRITGVQGVSGINNHDWTVIYSSPIEIELSGAILSGNYVTGGWLSSVPSGVDPYWDDTRPKGHFMYASYGYDYRDIAINPSLRLGQTGCGFPQQVNSMSIIQDCLPINICAPSVIAITPNGETFSNGSVYTMPTISSDETYPTLWQGYIIQNINDPLFDTPANPCQTDEFENSSRWTHEWQQDNGTCQSAGTDEFNGQPILRYPAPPSFEAITGYPDGAPALPSDFNTPLPVATSLSMLSSSCPTNIRVIQPPQPMGASANPAIPNAGTTDTFIYLNELTCVCDEGAFAPTYQSYEIRCANNGIVPAP